MGRYVSFFSIFIGIIALLNVYPHLLSSASANPKQVRVVVQEHRLHFESSSCLDQHLKEHLYARLVDQELTERGYKAFSVDAVAAIDKIIISVEHWDERGDLGNIALAAAAGIAKRPGLDIVEQERSLVRYENALLAKTPQFGASATAALLATEEATRNETCVAEQSQAAGSKSLDWTPGEFEVYEYKDSGEYTRITSSQAELATFPNAWDDLSEAPKEANLKSQDSTPNALFIAYKGRADPLLTTKLLAGIYDNLTGTELRTEDVRPFGKAGFIMQGENSLLTGLQKKLRRTFGSSPVSQPRANNLRLAWASVCGSRARKSGGTDQLSDERIAHTYFEYSANGTACEEGSDLSGVPSNLVVISNLIHVPKTDSELPRYENDMSFALCIPSENFVREDLSIAAYAMRQHLRYDVGLALNIQFSKIENNCVDGAVFAPKANTEPLSELLTNFDSTDDAYSARYAAAAIIYHCSQATDALCSKGNGPGPIIETPKLVVSVE